jgi:hypothetical protein
MHFSEWAVGAALIASLALIDLHSNVGDVGHRLT